MGLCCLTLAPRAEAQVTLRASIATNGTQGNGNSPDAAGARISGNGRYVVFKSKATNLIPGGTNQFAQIFRRDLLLGTTELVSEAADGSIQGGDGDSHNPSISADGRFVAFTSYAENLVGSNYDTFHSGDTNGFKDVFVRDMLLGTTSLASVDSNGAQGNGVSDASAIWASADGQSITVAFRSEATNLVPLSTSGSQVFVRKVTGGIGSTSLVSVSVFGLSGGAGTSGMLQQSISANGRYVGFTSAAANLVPGDTNGLMDVFVRDLQTNTTKRVSLSNTGAQGNNICFTSVLSADGRYVAFSSYANNMVSGDSNGFCDVFVRDTVANTTTRVSLDSGGKQANGDSGTSDGWGVSISADGMKVAFVSNANNLLGPNKDRNTVADIFVRDRSANKTTVVSIATNGTQANWHSFCPSISADGQYVSFATAATNLVLADTIGFEDVFVRGPAR
jgi:Tol biopolymer transport system component